MTVAIEEGFADMREKLNEKEQLFSVTQDAQVKQSAQSNQKVSETEKKMSAMEMLLTQLVQM